MATVITNWSELDDVRNNLSTDYVLGSDIDENTSGYDTYASSNANGGSGWLPIGDSSNQYIGNFDGSDYTISGMYIDRSSTFNVGLFSSFDGATVENVTLRNVDIVATGGSGGTLCGEVDNGSSNSTLIRNCTVSGQKQLSSDESSLGGFMGYCDSRTTVEDSVSEVDVTAPDGSVGGFVPGTGSAEFKGCTVSASVSGSSNVGGFASAVASGTTISNCYAVGAVDADFNNVGGFVNDNGGTIQTSYSVGDVTASNDTQEIGGFCRLNDNTITDCYWDNEASAVVSNGNDLGNKSDGGTALNTAEMTGSSAESNMSGFDFSTVWTTTDSYPELQNLYELVRVTTSIARAQTSTDVRPFNLSKAARRGKVGTIYILVEYQAPSDGDIGKSQLQVENIDKSRTVFVESAASSYVPNESQTFVVSETANDGNTLSNDSIEVSLNVTQSDDSGQFSIAFGSTLKSNHAHKQEPGIIESFNPDLVDTLKDDLVNNQGQAHNSSGTLRINDNNIRGFVGDDSRYERTFDIRGLLNPGEFNSIEILGNGIGHMQVWVEGDVYRTLGGNG